MSEVSPMPDDFPTDAAPAIDEMICELEKLGWRRWRGQTWVWESPAGNLYRGPYRAWTIATGQPYKQP